MNSKTTSARTTIITSISTVIVIYMLLHAFTGLTATLTVAAVLYTQYRIITRGQKTTDKQPALLKQPTLIP